MGGLFKAPKAPPGPKPAAAILQVQRADPKHLARSAPGGSNAMTEDERKQLMLQQQLGGKPGRTGDGAILTG